MPHTEGPRHVRAIDKLCTAVIAGEECVALCYGPNRNDDARLIAVAPRLAELLGSLHDLQNGPPLEKHAKEWTSVMQEAGNLLDELGV